MDKNLKKIVARKRMLFLVFGIACLMLSFGLKVAAQTTILPDAPNAECPAGYTGNCGDYGLDDFLLLGVNVAKWILGIVGSIALLFFIYGGFTFLISGGSATQVDKGKKIITGAVIGLVIVFASYLIIKFVLQAFGANGCIQQYALDGYMCMDPIYSNSCATTTDASTLCPGTTYSCCQK
jgi:hypothetical protein